MHFKLNSSKCKLLEKPILLSHDPPPILLNPTRLCRKNMTCRQGLHNKGKCQQTNQQGPQPLSHMLQTVLHGPWGIY